MEAVEKEVAGRRLMKAEEKLMDGTGKRKKKKSRRSEEERT